MESWTWPPRIPELAEYISDYYLGGEPLSIADDGGVIGELEKLFGGLHGREFALAVSSGTMALYSAFWGLGLEPGDEAICTAFSFHATAAPLLHLGVKIIFCDIEEDTGNIDPSLLEELITDRTRLVVGNDQWGHPCDKKAILAICRKHGLQYVEDCSHAHFSEYNGRYCGTFGEVACWSLQGAKMFSGGEGGILLTDNREAYERAVLLGHNLKRPARSVRNPLYKPLERTGFGLKLRMHPLAALIVLWQLKHCREAWIGGRGVTLTRFQEGLPETGVLFPMNIRNYVSSMGAWYGFMPRITPGVDRTHLVRWLNARGIPASIPKSPPLHQLALFTNPAFAIHGNYQKKQLPCPNAEKYFQSIVSFPTWTFQEYDKVDACLEALVCYKREFQ